MSLKLICLEISPERAKGSRQAANLSYKHEASRDFALLFFLFSSMGLIYFSPLLLGK